MVDESFIAAEAPPDRAASDVNTVNEKSPPQAALPDRNDLQHEIAELKRSFADFMRRDQPEIDRMREELHETTLQRDNTAEELNKLKRSQALSSIAAEYSFNDTEYLEFVLHKNKVQIDDRDAVKSFMRQLKSEKPRFFNLKLKAGSGSRPGNAPENVFPGSDLKRMDALEMLIAHAREIV